MDPSHSSAGGNSETGGPLQGQCRPSAVTQTLPCVLTWWRGCGPEEVSLIRTLIPPGGLHLHDLITSQSLHLPTLSPLWVRVSRCKHSDHSIDLLFFFFLIFIWLRQILVVACRTFRAPCRIFCCGVGSGQHVKSYFPSQGSNPHPCTARRLLNSTGPPGKSHIHLLLDFVYL